MVISNDIDEHESTASSDTEDPGVGNCDTLGTSSDSDENLISWEDEYERDLFDTSMDGIMGNQCEMELPLSPKEERKTKCNMFTVSF